MRIFLELIKPQTEEEAELGIPPQEVRYEVADEREAEKLLRSLKHFLNLDGWTAQIHYCRHEEGRACEVKKLK